MQSRANCALISQWQSPALNESRNKWVSLDVNNWWWNATGTWCQYRVDAAVAGHATADAADAVSMA